MLLKLSGEALAGAEGFGISEEVLEFVAREVRGAVEEGVRMGIVVGGGNIFRGVAGASRGMDRVKADYMGMLATLINSVALSEALRRVGLDSVVMSALEVREVAEPFVRERALGHLKKGRVVIFACGTGNPFFTTDTAATLRALEIGAELLLKATKVDGVYSDDPERNPSAKKFERLSYEEVLRMGLRVMDATAISLAKEHGLPVLVFNMLEKGNIRKAVLGQKVGTVIGG